MLLEEILKRQPQKCRALIFLQISSLGFFKSSRLARKRSHIDLVGISLDLRNDRLPREIVERNQVDFILAPPVPPAARPRPLRTRSEKIVIPVFQRTAGVLIECIETNGP